MRKTVTTRYDVAEHLRTAEEMAAYLEACLEEADGDAAFIAKALGDIARARGMTQVARDAGISRESLYKALSGKRSFDTILKGIEALGLRLHVEVGKGRPQRPTFRWSQWLAHHGCAGSRVAVGPAIAHLCVGRHREKEIFMTTKTSPFKRAIKAAEQALGPQRYGAHDQPFACLFCGHDRFKLGGRTASH